MRTHIFVSFCHSFLWSEVFGAHSAKGKIGPKASHESKRQAETKRDRQRPALPEDRDREQRVLCIKEEDRPPPLDDPLYLLVETYQLWVDQSGPDFYDS